MSDRNDMTKLASHQPRSASTRAQNRCSRAFLVFSWALVALMLALIFFMSSRTGEMIDTSSGIISIIRNALLETSVALFGHPIDVSPIGHFAEFFLLGAALLNALRLTFPLRKAALCASLFASLYGASDEIHQIFVAGRSCDPMDWLVDTLAALFAVTLFALLVYARQKRKDSHTHDANISL